MRAEATGPVHARGAARPADAGRAPRREGRPRGGRDLPAGARRRPVALLLHRWFGLGPDGVFAVAALLAGSGLFLDALPGAAYDVYWLLYLIVGLLMLYRLGLAWVPTVLAKLPLLCGVLAVALASTLWSVDPWLTFRAAVALVGTTMIGIFVGYRFEPNSIMRILHYTFAAIIVVTLAVVVLAPGYATESFPRGYLPVAWKGAAVHRNVLGVQAAFAAVFFAVQTMAGRLTRARGAAFGGLSLVLIVMAQSMTSVAGLAIGLGLAGAFFAAKRLRFPSVAVAAAILVLGSLAGALLAAQPATFAGALGRDATLTGRTEVWRDALAIVERSPWRGHGFGAVWTGDNEPKFPYVRTIRYTPHAHNGYLQVATDLGVPAALAAGAYLLRTAYLALALFVAWGSAFSLYALAALSMALVMNATETWLLVPYGFVWIVFVTLGTAVARLRGARPAAAPSAPPRRKPGAPR